MRNPFRKMPNSKNKANLTVSTDDLPTTNGKPPNNPGIIRRASTFTNLVRNFNWTSKFN